MKKIFTLISMALVAMSVNAQDDWTPDVNYVAAPGGTMATEFANPTESGNDKIATIDLSPINLQVVSSKTPIEIPSAQGGASGLTEANWPEAGWNAAEFKIGGNNKESQPTIPGEFYSVIGSGVPYVSFVSKQFWNEDGFADRYYPGFKADGDTDGWTYYNPDGSVGLPNSGNYVKATATEAGVMKIGTFVQSGDTRLLYIVKGSTQKALTWNADVNTTEYKVEGYSQNVKNADNTWVFIPSFTVENYIIGTETAYEYVDAGTNESKTANVLSSRKFIWFVFDAEPGETYYIFGNNWQIGFQGVKFYKGKTIKDYTPSGIDTPKAKVADNANAPIYNLAGQKVDKSQKGILIQNGKKFVNK
ncbi:MAG: hypothetical protein IJ190_07350 [Prevotella sp.]|nr:hypothetical protein [Prevotella sp.]